MEKIALNDKGEFIVQEKSGITIPFFKNLLLKKIITINKKGIYYYGTFLTNWKNLMNASISEREANNQSKCDAYLTIDYRKENENGFYHFEILLNAKQNKTENEIIDAIKYFSNNDIKN